MSGAQPKAGNISECITICAEVNIKAIETRHSQNWVDEVIDDTEKLVERVKNAQKTKKLFRLLIMEILLMYGNHFMKTI